MPQLNQTTIIRFDGRYLSYTDINGNLITLPAISGRINNQNADLQSQEGLGPLPEGLYNVKQTDYQHIDRVIDNAIGILSFGQKGKWPFGEISWGTERVWLQPQDGNEMYDRIDLSIHGGWSAGSAGCIDLVGNAPIFFEFFKSLGQDVVLQVDYGSGIDRYNGSDNPFLIDQPNPPTIETIYANQGLNLTDLDPLIEFNSTLKHALEIQLNQSIPEQEYFNLISNNNYHLTPSSEINEFFNNKYDLNINFDQLTQNFFNVTFDEQNYLLLKDLQNASQSEQEQYLQHFFDSSFANLHYDLNAITNNINYNNSSVEELTEDYCGKSGL